MNDLKIEYCQGRMIINLDNFLPAPQARLKKLLKINELDWRNSENNLQTLIDYIKKRIEIEKHRKTEAEEKYIKNFQPMKDIERIVESGKTPNGVLITNRELKAKKEEYRHLKAVLDAANSDHNRSIRNIERLAKNLNQLEELKR